MRIALLLCLMIVPASGDETRLGTLIRLYLDETRPSRQFDLAERIERLVEGDVGKVATAIRKKEHCRFSKRPVFLTGKKPPEFDPRRLRIEPVSAGDYAALSVPADYDITRSCPAVIDLGKGNMPVPPGTVQIKIDVQKHEQARVDAAVAEGLVLSILARAFELVNIDAERVMLRAQVGSAAALAWYIALHNPDRFAGLLTLQGFWDEAPRIALNALPFRILAVEPRGGHPGLRAFPLIDMRLVRQAKVLPFPKDPLELKPALETWQNAVRRRANPTRIDLIADRATTSRAYWMRVAPRQRSRRRGSVARIWRTESIQIPGTLIAEVDPKDRNLIRVRTHRVAAFHIYVDAAMFDVDRPLRVSINGGVPSANLIDQNLSVDALLEDYRERRDPQLLYAATFSFSVRREPSKRPR